MLRIGNAIYYSNIEEGMKLTEEAYYASNNFVNEHIYSAINYSSSLIQCGLYDKASKILNDVIDITQKSHNSTDIISLSIKNNYLIAEYCSNMQEDCKKISDEFEKLAFSIKDVRSSDSYIIFNNFISASLLLNNSQKYAKLKKICEDIISRNNKYHSFFAIQNLLLIYFLEGDVMQFTKLINRLEMPLLMKSHQLIFEKRNEFLLKNIHRGWDILELEKQLQSANGLDNNHELYYKPVIFGLIERWFE